MNLRSALGLVLLLVGCQTENGLQSVATDEYLAVVVPEIPEGYPWKMGDAVVTLDGAPRPYTTYDFSIGAFDAAVQLRKDYDCSGEGSCRDTGRVLLALRAHPGTDPEAETGVLSVTAVFDTLPEGPMAGQDVRVILTGIDGDLMSTGAATLTLTAIRRGKDGSQSYGTLSAQVTATICAAVDEVLTPGGACHDLAATFQTDVQYDSL